MKRAMLVGFYLLSVNCAVAQQTDAYHWTPDPKFLTEIDARAVQYGLPKTYKLTLKDYARYYWGTIEDGKKYLYGYFLNPSLPGFNGKAGIHVVPYDNTGMAIADGGCATVQFIFDVSLNEFERAMCGGSMPFPGHEPDELGLPGQSPK